MNKRWLTLALSILAGTLQAQTPDSLILGLKTINAAVAGPTPTPGKHLLLSNRALNIFLSEAAGYYLSTPDDLTLYKNSVVASSADGSFAVYHNLRQPAGVDSGIRSFLSIGAQATVADAFNAASSGRPYNNQFGFLLKYTWVGNPRVSASPAQIRTMDALRANILHSMEATIRKKAAEEEAALAAIDSADIPGQDTATANTTARGQFNSTLQQTIAFDYAHSQAETLARTFNYNVMAFNWTSFSIYLPLVTENFKTAPTPDDAYLSRHAWPLHLDLTHTRLWEGSRFGRLFATVAGNITLNNSRDSYGLSKTAGGYTGTYQTFLTPDVKAQLIYIPTDSHIGISFLIKQNFGAYHATDGILGFPIVLINKQAEPAINFEFQVRFYDLGHTIAGLPGHTAIGLTMGIPFSKIAF